MNNFSAPPMKVASKPIKSPEAIEFEKLPEAKKEEYKGFMEQKAIAEPIPFVAEPETGEILPDEADRREFVRCILGQKLFEKKYTLFGNVSVTFKDRTAFETEEVIRDISAGLASVPNAASEEDYAIWMERGLLTHSLVTLTSPERNFVTADEKDKRTKLLELPQPFYRALLETWRSFEEMLATMSDKANDPSFWKAGGSS